MTMWGADVQGLIDCSRIFGSNADLIDGSRANVDSTLTSTPWDGPDSTDFRGRWTGTMSPQLVTIAEALRNSAGDLIRNADEQYQASVTLGGGGTTSGAPGGPWSPAGPGQHGGPWGPIGPGGPWGPVGPWTPIGPIAGGDRWEFREGLQGDGSLGGLDGSYLVGGRGHAEGSYYWGPDGVGAEGSLGGFIGVEGDFAGRFDTDIGSAYADGRAWSGGEAELNGYFHSDENGSRMGADASARLGVGGELNVGSEIDGVVASDLAMSGFVGGEATAGANSYVELQENGGFRMGGDAHARAGFGATGGIDGGIDLGDGIFTLDAGISGRAGYVGAGGGFDAAFGWDEVGFGASGDIAKGLGLGGDLSFSFSPSGAWDAGASGLTDLGGVVDGPVGDVVGDAGDWLNDNPPWEWDLNPFN